MLGLLAASTTGFHAPATRMSAHSRTTAVEMAIPASVKIAGVLVPATSVAIWAGVQKFNAKNDAKAAEQGRAALAGMSSLQDLTGMSLDRAEFREIGDWKEYTKSNGKKWYYHKPTGTMQWQMPDELKEAWAPTTFEAR